MKSHKFDLQKKSLKTNSSLAEQKTFDQKGRILKRNTKFSN